MFGRVWKEFLRRLELCFRKNFKITCGLLVFYFWKSLKNFWIPLAFFEKWGNIAIPWNFVLEKPWNPYYSIHERSWKNLESTLRFSLRMWNNLLVSSVLVLKEFEQVSEVSGVWILEECQQILEDYGVLFLKKFDRNIWDV